MNRNCCCKANLRLNTTPTQPIKVDCETGSPFLNLNSKDTGPMGPVGPQGNGIDRIEKTSTSGLVDTYTIYYTNGEETTFDVNNGEKGDTGPAGKDAKINGVNTLTLETKNGITQSQTGSVLALSGKTLQDAISAETTRAEIVENALNTAINGKQEKLTQAQLNAVNSGITSTKVNSYDNHIANGNIHVTTQEKTTWNNKQNALNQTQMAAVNSGATTTNIGQITTNKNSIGTLSNLSTTKKTDLVSAINEVDGTAGTALQPSDVVNSVESTSTNKPLSANMGKELQEQIDNLKARGRFLALWNCSTGLAESNPPTGTYTYQSGDYFIVGVVAQSGGTNYKPDGSSYTTGVASTVVETQVVDTDDVYYYDGNVWRLQVNTQKTVSFDNIAGDPYDNSNLAAALNEKQDELVQGNGISIDSSTNTISNSGVRGISTGSTNGTISVNTNGTSSDVSVAGLGSAAYTASTDYATSAQGGLADTAIQPNDNITELNNNAGFINNTNDCVHLSGVETMTSAKKIFASDVSMAGNQAAVFATISNNTTTISDSAWVGRYICGAKNLTFLMGTYKTMAGLGAHAWTNAQTGAGPAWADLYINPDGNKTVYIGGKSWTKDSGWFRVVNSGSVTDGYVQVNKGSITSEDWKDVAYKGEKISDFNNDSGYITSSSISNMQTTTNIVTSISASSTDAQYPSAKCVWDIVGNIETLLYNINSGTGE